MTGAPWTGVLGAAAVEESTLRAMVADLLGAPVGQITDVHAEVVSYDLPAITTAGRYWVRGRADVGGARRDWRLFVKHVQSWSRSPFFQFVPEAIREQAAAMVPWRTEAAAYRSDLGDHLPAGLSMPRAVGVFDLDAASQAVWLEAVEVADVVWDLPRHELAALLLGRLAASPALHEYRGLGGHGWHVGLYADGRLKSQVLPMLRADEPWHAPDLAPAFADLRPRLLAAADRVEELMTEWQAFPVLTGHGDACPNNLLVRPDQDGFTLIDFGFWGALPLGFDLGQLLVGDVQVGRRSVDDLAERDEACLRAYHRGLAIEGFEVALDDLRRAHALQLLMFTGLSAFIVEGSPAAGELETRAALTRYSLDLLDATALS